MAIESPGERANVWQTLGDVIRRLARLEANPRAAGVIEITSDDLTITVVNPTGPIVDLSTTPAIPGIKYDYPNDGGYLDIVANDLDPDAFGQIYLQANGSDGDAGSLYIDVLSEPGVEVAGVNIGVNGSGTADVNGLEVDANAEDGQTQGLTVLATSVNNDGAPTYGLEVLGGVANGTADAVGADIRAQADAGDAYPLRLYANGLKVLEVDANGDIHILTTASVIADLPP